MKNNINKIPIRLIIFIIMVILVGSCDNEELSSNQADTFLKLYGSWSFDEGKDVKQISDGYIIVGTTTVSLDGGKDIVLMKTNKFGNIVWEKTYGGSDDDTGSKVLITEDGYIIVGTISDDTNNDDVYVIKVDQKGEIQWTKQIGGVFNETGNSIVMVDDGFVICGSTTEPNDVNGNPAGKANILLAKISSSGNIIWMNSFGGPENDYGNDLLVTSGGYLALGTTNSFSEPGQAGSNIIIVKTNGEGTENDKMTYGGPFADLGNAVIHATGGGYIIVGSKGHSATNSKVYMAKVQENIHNIDFEYSLGAEVSYGFGFDIVEHWGKYSIVGSKSLGENNAGFFIETDENGALLYEKEFGGNSDQVLYSVENTSESGYVMVGKSGQGTNYMICLIKLNSKGSL